MNKIICVVMAALLISCSVPLQTPQGMVKPYGLFNRGNPCVIYEVSGWNVVWSIFLFETIIIPVLIIGYDIMEPVGYYKDCKDTRLIVRP